MVGCIRFVNHRYLGLLRNAKTPLQDQESVMNVSRRIPTVDFADMLGDERQQERFVQAVGDSLKDIGFFALKNHGVDLDLIERSYEQSDVFFSLPKTTKQRYLQPEISHQRGYTAFGVEHAKDNDAPDLKEFWQNGRTHTGKGPQPTYPANVWPEADAPEFKGVIDDLFNRMEGLAQQIPVSYTHLTLPTKRIV